LFNILLIGAGQLGSRHLQALSLIDREAAVDVVDPNLSSLETAKKRFLEVSKGTKIREVNYYSSLNDIPDTIDAAIVASNSNVRRKIIEDLLAAKNVRALILEKFLFQREEDFSAVHSLLTKKNVSAWVNCPRRMWPLYQNIKRELQGEKPIEFMVTGTSWALGSNAVHMIDLFSFLCNSTDYQISFTDLDKTITQSKRSGYIEFTGRLSGEFSNHVRFSIASYNGSGINLVIHLRSEKTDFIIKESEGKILTGKGNEGWKWKEEQFTVLFQSQLTHHAVENIIDTGSCDLTPYEESQKLHLPLLRTFMDHMQFSKPGELITSCPIT